LLPGTPKPLERLRELVIEKFGILGVTVARFHFGRGIQSSHSFIGSINKLGVKFTAAEAKQVQLTHIYCSMN
jgi:hypothetical protein